MSNEAIVVVDMLYDFIDGSLACEGAQEAVAKTAAMLACAAGGDENDEDGIAGIVPPVLFICDHHPADHSSFKEFGGIWPAHCVQGTRGGAIHEDLVPYVTEELTFYKGCDRAVEQYSGFEGRNSAGQTLGEILELLGITTVKVCGIATEYCVLNTAKDLLAAGLKVEVLEDCLGYVSAEGHRSSLQQMKQSGFKVKTSK